MPVYRSLAEVPAPPGGTAVAIGNFDGLHLGHRKILRRLAREGRALGLPAWVLTFSPHPERLLGRARITMIQPLEARIAGLEEAGARAVVVARFTRALAALTPEEFADRILRRQLHARLVVVGAGFRFGRERRGGTADLERLGRRLDFDVLVVPPARRAGRVVSSSAIRGLLASGRVEEAASLLGRPYEIEGDVVRGHGRGHGLGAPTVNLQTPNEILPRGIFLTVVRADGRPRPSVTNVGTGPTFGGRRLTVETHILGFRGDLYGRPVRLAFLRKVRDERAFPDPAALAGRIRRDIEAARRFFRRREAL